ncbi:MULTISPECIES: flagellar associated protein [unclassified Nocardiopsis]|uniref:flagellar associated protein n=1 Tax=Nocardiopsis TaxID=2013 RepID=UPI00387A98B1
MSRTSRTARAPRAAAVVRPPSLLLVPLFVGAALAALWLIGTPSAQADTAGPLGLDRAASLDTGPAPGLNSLDPALDPLDPALEAGVTEVAAPVTGTLGTVHRRLEERTGSAPAAVLADPAVGEVGGGVQEGARRVVRELAAVDQDQAENLVAHVASTRLAPAPAPAEAVAALVSAAADPAGTGLPDARAHAEDEKAGRSGEADEDTAEAGPDGLRDTVPGLFPAPRAAGAAADTAAADEHRPAAPADRGVSAAPQTSQLSTGSAAPTGAGAPAVAGFLTVVPLTAPAADALSNAVDAVHPVPAGAADDPTVSPD